MSSLLACRLRFETLTAPVRPCGVAKISKAGENLLDNQFVYILGGIEAANILGEVVT